MARRQGETGCFPERRSVETSWHHQERLGTKQMSKNYDIDDILSEIKGRKSREKQQPAREVSPRRGEASQDPFEDSLSRRTREPAMPDEEELGDFDFVEPEPEPDFVHEEAPPPPSPPRRTAPQRRTEPEYEDYEPERRAPASTPVQQPVRRPAPPPRQKVERPTTNPMGLEGNLRPITDKARQRNRYADLAQGRSPVPPTRRPPARRLDFDAAEQMEGEEGEEFADNASLQQGHTQVLRTPGQQARRPRISGSSLTGQDLNIEDMKRIDFDAVEGAGSGYDGYYEPDEADAMMDDFQEGSVMEYREYRRGTDRRDVAMDVARTKLFTFIRAAGTGFLTFLLFYFTMAGKYFSMPMISALLPEKNLGAYLIVCTVLTGLVLIVNIGSVVTGIGNIFRMRANSDTLAAFAVIMATIQGIVSVSNQSYVLPENMHLYFASAALCMFCNTLGRLFMLGRIQSNFKVVSSKLPKRGVMAVESDDLCHELVPDAIRKPTISYSAAADFFSDFLGLSFSDKYDVGINRSVAPVCLVGAFLVGIATRLLSGSTFTAVSAATAVLCISATLSAVFLENIPLSKLAKRLNPQGAMVSGNKAVENFCDTEAFILDETDLFPRGNVVLSGMRPFAGARIDEVILDAASVLCKLDNSLSPLFLEIIGGNRNLLKKADNIVYENGMGLSAWVDGRRVLIGNRMLMQNHGITLPNDTYERENPGNPPGNPIYLSNSGEVAARFLVDYVPDEDMAYELEVMASHNKQMVVYTTDANINEQKIWEVYGYPLELITIMASELHEEYREISAPQEELPAEIVYTGGAAGYLAALSACITARASILSGTILQLIQIVVGYGFVAFMAFMGVISQLSIFQLAVYQVAWLGVILLVQQLRRP